MKGERLKLILVVAFILWLSQGDLSLAKQERQNLPPDVAALEPITKEDRILVFAPHPDDETLGTGGIIQQAVNVGADVRVMYLTNGEHNQLSFIVYEKRLVIKQEALIEMGKMRQNEAIAAMKVLGVPEENLIFLGYPDFGMLAIFLRHWGDEKPFKNMLTRVSNVPYKNALTPNASYKGEAVLWDIESVLKKYKPTRIFVTSSVDTNRDHKAAYLFLRVALWNLKGQIPEPKVYPYLIHCYAWPKPRNYHPSLYLGIPKLLEHSQIRWVSRNLSAEEVQKKHQAILLYKSQCANSAFYLSAFARKNELFGEYPVIDASMPEIATTFRDKTVAYARLGENLLVNVYIRREADARHRLFYINLAGYSPSVDFSHMPKLKINVEGDKIQVLDRGHFIKVEGLEVKQKRHVVSLKIPLKLLNDPQYILASVNTYTENFPSDLNAWRVIRVR